VGVLGGWARTLDHANRHTLEVGVRGSGGGATYVSPVVVSLADRVELGANRRTLLSVGIEGASATALTATTWSVGLGFAFVAGTKDRDSDGVADDEDMCPDLPGPRAGPPEDRGCPQDADGPATEPP
jgi:hypothetical protein